MASAAKIMHPLPDTLPEDFSEWDGGNSAATLPVKSSVSEPATERGSATVPPAQPESPQVWSSVLDGTVPPPKFSAASFTAEDEARLWDFRPSDENEDVEKTSRRKMIVLAISAVAPILLLLILVPRLDPRLFTRLVSLKGSIAGLSATTDSIPAVDTLQPPTLKQLKKPARSTTSAVDASSAQSDTDAEQAANDAQKAAQLQAQSQIMADQLTAPYKIPQVVKVVPQEDPPAATSLAVADLEGLSKSGSNVTRSAFGSASDALNVKEATPGIINISASTADGMLIKKTIPEYPAIARAARISGAVVMLATISKSGTVESVHAVKGPDILRLAAVDAVKTWRYRPYLLNGEPVEVETTVSIEFTTGN